MRSFGILICLVVAVVAYEKPGDCPIPVDTEFSNDTTVTYQECSRDFECPGELKCCGMTCTPPVCDEDERRAPCRDDPCGLSTCVILDAVCFQHPCSEVCEPVWFSSLGDVTEKCLYNITEDESDIIDIDDDMDMDEDDDELIDDIVDDDDDDDDLIDDDMDADDDTEDEDDGTIAIDEEMDDTEDDIDDDDVDERRLSKAERKARRKARKLAWMKKKAQKKADRRRMRGQKKGEKKEMKKETLAEKALRKARKHAAKLARWTAKQNEIEAKKGKVHMKKRGHAQRKAARLAAKAARKEMKLKKRTEGKAARKAAKKAARKAARQARRQARRERVGTGEESMVARPQRVDAPGWLLEKKGMTAEGQQEGSMTDESRRVAPNKVPRRRWMSKNERKMKPLVN